MSYDFTPTAEQVRSHYVFNQSDDWDPERGKAFDRWLAARDAKMRAQGFDRAVASMTYDRSTLDRP